MKNNFIKIILIIVASLNMFQYASGDIFNFKVSEIQISENGNLIKGINGGTVTSNSNIVITADNFEYNKLTLLLKANGNVKLIDIDQNITIESNEVFYEKDKEKIYTRGESKANNTANIEIFANEYFRYNKLTSLLEAKGNVLINDKKEDITIETNEFFYLKNKEKFFTKGKTKVFVEKKYIINTKNLIFLRSTKLLSSNEKTTLEDSTLHNIYKLANFEYSIDQEILKGKNIEVTTNNQKNDSDIYFFKNGFFDLKDNKFLTKDVNIKFHKTLFDDDENDPRVNAAISYGDEFNTYFEKGVFTSCKKTDKCPPWKIRSNKIHHDKIKKQIIYTNAWLNIYDIPVVYFPKFFHPDPSVKRQSGFLKPELGSSKNLGNSIYAPYFFAVSQDKDFTFKPRLFNDNKIVLQSEYRQITKNSNIIADFSLTRGHSSSKNDKNATRTHFFANSKIDLDMEKFSKSTMELKYEKTSNDNYLKLFDLESPLLLGSSDVLESKILFNFEHENYDLSTSFELYETLNGSNSDRYTYVLPSYNFIKNFRLKDLDGHFNFNSQGNNTLNSTNVTTSIISNDLNYNSNNNFFNNGLKTNYGISLKNINSMGKNSETYKSSPQTELLTAYIFNTSLPLIKNTKNILNTLEPRLSFRFSPHDMKGNKNLKRRVDMNNIYNFNRLSMGDSFEGGQSMTVGINYKKEKLNTKKKINQIEEYLDLRLATVFRLNEENDIPLNSTLNKKSSNIFGQLNYKPTNNFSLNYNFSLNNDLNTIEYNSLSTKFNFNNFSTRFEFLEERGVIGETNIIENITKYNLDTKNSLIFKTRRNGNLGLTEYYDLIYEYKNDCLIAGLEYKKNYYNDADIKPIEELFFSITIIPLATFSPDKMVLK